MEQKEIDKEFEKFGISKNDLPVYVDPYTFAKNIKKCQAYQIDQISYSNNTLPLENLNHA